MSERTRLVSERTRLVSEIKSLKAEIQKLESEIPNTKLEKKRLIRLKLYEWSLQREKERMIQRSRRIDANKGSN